MTKKLVGIASTATLAALIAVPAFVAPASAAIAVRPAAAGQCPSSMRPALAPRARAGTGMSAETTAASAGTDRGNERTAFRYLTRKGLTAEQAAGVVGNLDWESGMDPRSAQQGGGPGRGIAQWGVGGRWDTYACDNAQWYADSHRRSVHALSLQLDFTWYELTAFSYYGLAQLRSSTTIDDAVAAFQDNFERCNPTYCATEQRQAEAHEAYHRYARPATLWGGSALPNGSADDVFWMAASGRVRHTDWTGSRWDTHDLDGLLSASPAATARGSRYDVFAVSTDGRLLHKRYYHGAWSGWHTIGSGFSGGVSAVWTGSAFNVFGHDPNGAVRHAYWGGHGWHVADLGGGATVGTPALSYHPGRYDVYSVSPGGRLYHRRYWHGAWTGWYLTAS
jgi:hypothetical protein